MGGDHHAGRKSLDIPLPGSGQGFVEIVDVEEDVALRRREAAEIHQVSVAAGLHAKSGRRGRGKVRRHDRGRAAIEGERRLGHAAEADRDQFCDAAFVGLAQKLDRIAPILGRLPTALRGARRRGAQRLPCGAPLVRGYVGWRGAGRRLSTVRFSRSPYACSCSSADHNAALMAGCIGPAKRQANTVRF